VPSFVPARVRRVLGILGIAALCLVALGLAAPPASAHPFGDPQTLELTADSDEVRLRWHVGMSDDVTALALHLGLLPHDRVLLDGAVLYEDGDDDLLAASPLLPAYLLDRLIITAGGSRCPGEVVSAGALMDDGVLLSFRCPGGVPGPTSVNLEVRTLTDLHPAYRTLASGPSGQRAVYDGDHPEHTWTLGGAPVEVSSASSSAVVQLGSALVVLVGTGAAGAFYVRRRGRRTEVSVG
jgi:hypothetical protein